MQVLRLLSFSLGVISFIFLLQFGVKSILHVYPAHAWWGPVSLLTSLAVVVAISFGGITGWSQVIARYLIGFPGALLTALAFFRYARSDDIEALGSPRLAINLRGAAVTFGLYAILAGLIGPRAPFFPASHFNQETFVEAIGLPIQVFRAICAVAATYFIVGVLNLFATESRRRLEMAHGELLLSNERQMARPTILMLSSAGKSGEIARCRELGVAAYLIKPIKPSELLDAIVTSLSSALEASTGPEAIPAPAIAPGRRNLRVLVAEDDAVNRLVIVRILEKAGHAVAVAMDGQEAVEKLECESFDLVLMDVQMPVLGGFEATTLIREKEKGTNKHMTIVAMTAHAMKGDRERCLAAGMDGYVAKPVHPRELFHAMDAFFPSKVLAAGDAQVESS